MIIVKLMGGIGNQMFQYAHGRNYAKEKKCDFKLDIYHFNFQYGCTKRKYELEVFNVENDIINNKPTILKNNINIIKTKLYQNRYSRYFIKKNKQIYYLLKNNRKWKFQEQSFNNGKILKIKNNIYLEGWWQSEKYFKDIKNIIRKEFTLKKDSYKSLDRKLLKKIQKNNSISIHIRRGDYISNEETSLHHGICPLDYYQKAIGVIIKKIDNPHFFIFSDDINWCKKNLKIKFPTIFAEGNKDYEDMILMSKCKHNIIANSSFSWWGAWLNDNPDKIVITPKKWFNNPSINTADLIPKLWIKI